MVFPVCLFIVEKLGHNMNKIKITDNSVLKNLWIEQRRLFTDIQDSSYNASKDGKYKELVKFLENLGLNDMSVGLEDTLQYLQTKDIKYREIKTIDKNNETFELLYNRTPRILFISFVNYPNYGLDIIYDGLCQLLGHENIFDYPYKSTLHGGDSNRCGNYPCFFNYSKTTTIDKDKCLSLISKQYFDFVVYCYHPENMQNDIFDKCLQTNTPIIALDQEDVYDIDFKFIEKYNVKLYFKREMLNTIQYPDNIKPLTFSYPMNLFPEDTIKYGDREIDNFWAGKLYYTRTIILKELEKRKLITICKNNLDKDTYSKHLQNSKMGINLFGWGFDTVRYYEIPANGCLMFSERHPLDIRNDYTDDMVVYFSSIPELLDKIQMLKKDESKCANMAKLANEHCKKYHNNVARTKQMLHEINKVVNLGVVSEQ